MDRISEEREVLLVQRAQDGCEKSMLELMEAYRPAIRAQVRKVEPYYDLDDAEQEAKLAFMQMVYNHDTERGRLFQRVKAELTNALREASCLQNSHFHIPLSTQRRFRTILSRADHDPAAGVEIAQDNGMSKEVFLAIYYSLYGREELDTAGESLWDTQIVDADSALLVEQARSVLNNEEKIVIDAAYGFVTYEPLSDYEISRGLINKSPSTVRRIRNRALVKMRMEVLAA